MAARVRALLDKLGYLGAVSDDSLPLVERLLADIVDRDEQVRSLEHERHQLAEEVQELAAERDALDEEASVLRVRVDRHRERSASLKAECEQVRQGLEELIETSADTAETDNGQAGSAAVRAAENKLQQIVDQLSADVEDDATPRAKPAASPTRVIYNTLLEENQELKARIDKLAQERAAAVAEIEQLRKPCVKSSDTPAAAPLAGTDFALEGEIIHLRQMIKGLEREKNACIDEYVALEDSNRRQGYQVHLDRVVKDLAVARKEREVAVRDMAQAMQDLAACREQLCAAEEGNARLAELYSQAVDDLDEANVKCKELSNQVAELRRHVNQQEEVLAVFNQEHRAAITTHAATNTRLSDLENELRELDTERAALLAELREYRELHDELQCSLADTQHNFTVVLDENRLLLTTRDVLQGKVQAMEGRIRELTALYGDDQQHTDELLRTCSRLNEEKVNSEQRAREAANEASELREKLAHAETEVQMLRRSLGDSTRTFASHKEQSHELLESLHVARKQLQALQREYANLQCDYDAVRAAATSSMVSARTSFSLSALRDPPPTQARDGEASEDDKEERRRRLDLEYQQERSLRLSKSGLGPTPSLSPARGAL